MAAVAACKWVDEVVPNAPYQTLLEWMDKYNCDFCVHGDHVSTLADGSDSYQHVKDKGRYLECKRTKGVSTTDLVSRMLLMTQSMQPSHPGDLHQDQSQNHHLTHDLKANGTCSDESNGTVTIPSNSDAQHVMATTRKIAPFSYGNKEPKKGTGSALGDYLVVGVYDDSTVRAVKGVGHPLLDMHERVLSLLACRRVDDVVMGAPYSITDQVLDGDYRVNLVVRGSTPSSNDIDGQDPYRLAKERGIFVQLEEPPYSVTTESIVYRILKNRQLP
ncbi:Ethanolamine-phosphate cytidylyltransferase [Mortierella sp. AD094]|nr:Ethanolamine-phosphate cytidylyltransferase [Mortierella sp. AD094]